MPVAHCNRKVTKACQKVGNNVCCFAWRRFFDEKSKFPMGKPCFLVFLVNFSSKIEKKCMFVCMQNCVRIFFIWLGFASMKRKIGRET